MVWRLVASASRDPPMAESLRVGYGLAPSARGHGYATEALGTLVQIATGLGVMTILADTEPDDGVSQRTLERVGFAQVAVDSDLRRYEVSVNEATTMCR